VEGGGAPSPGYTPPEPVTIRDYETGDFDSLFEIDRAAFAPDLAYSRSELRFYVRSPRSRTLIAEEEGEIVGFAIGCLERAAHGHVVTLDVRPGHQRRGIGGLLLRALEERLQALGARAFFLETPAEEDGARRFYERQGYAVLRRERAYYNGRRDAWRMVKRTLGAPEG
jgi:ribosomal-protein-alanine N-acetyltransferase